MAVHRSPRRDNRAYSVFTGCDSPQGAVHVGQTKAQNRLRIHLSISVSIFLSHLHTISTEGILIYLPTTYQSHNLRSPPHLRSSLRSRRCRRHPRSRRTHTLAPGRGPLRPSCMQRLLSSAIHGSSQYKLRHSRRLESGKWWVSIARHKGKLKIRVWIRLQHKLPVEIVVPRSKEKSRDDVAIRS